MRHLVAVAFAAMFFLASVGAVAAREPAVRLTYLRTAGGMSLEVVAGSTRAAAWQVEVRGVARSATHRLVIAMAPTDTGWSGTARIQNLANGGTWVTTTTMDLSTVGQKPLNAQAIHDTRLGITVSTLSITPPTNGNPAMIVRFSRTRPGVRVQVTGAIRLATQAFALGPWVRTDAIVR
jgi:hypothetical protein